MEAAIIEDLDNSSWTTSPIGRLVSNFASLFERGEDEDHLEVARFKISQFTPQELYRSLQILFEDPAARSSIASTSYLHGNGFYKIVLHDSSEFCLRLHIWVPGNHSQENLHGHRWPFISKVYSGFVTNEIWMDAYGASAPEYDEYLYTGKNEPLKHVGKARVRKAESQIIKTGSTYVMSPELLHRIFVPENAIVSTLMLRTAPTRAWTRNIVVNEVIPDAKPNYMSNNQLFAVLQEYLPELKRSIEFVAEGR